jgi:hypothetical protein
MSNDAISALIRDALSQDLSKRNVAGAIRQAYNAGVESVKSKLGRPAMTQEVAQQKLADALAAASQSADALSLVEWGGTATGKSVFFNAALDRKFERTLVSVLKAVSSGRPLSNLGCGTGNHGNKARTVRTDRDMRRKENRSGE